MNVLQKAKEKEKIPDQILGESKRKRENPQSKIGGQQEKNSRSKIGGKQKQNIQKGRWTRKCLNNV